MTLPCFLARLRLVHLATRSWHPHPCRHPHSSHSRQQHTSLLLSTPPSTPSAPAATAAPSSPTNSLESITALTSWILSSGGHFSQIEARFSPTSGRALHTREPIRKGESIIRIPRSCLILGSAAVSSEIGRLITDTGKELSHTGSYVSAFLLEEKAKGSASPYHLYLATLPTNVSHFPVMWSDATLDLLQGSLALPLIRSYQRDINADHLLVMHSLPSFSLEEWMWARLTVSSRGFGGKLEGVDELLLVPLIDLINHSLEPNTVWGFDPSTLTFHTTTARPLRADEEVHESYGDKCNSLLLTYYGFTMPSNPHNSCSLRLALAPSDERLRMQKTALLDAMHDSLAEALEFNPTATYGEEALRMLSFMRVAQADEEEVRLLMEAKRKGEGKDAKKALGKEGGTRRVAIIGKANEERVWKAVAVEARRRLGEFRESEEDDERMMREGKYTQGSAEWHCAVMRKSEKAVLRWWLESAELMQRMLQQGILALMSHEAEVDERGLEKYRVGELSPLLRRWEPGSRKAHFIS